MLASRTDPTVDSLGGLFTHFVGCVRRKDAASAISARLVGPHADGANVKILDCQNLLGVTQADTVLLACQPHMYKAVFDEPGMREALRGKLIISVLAGVTTVQLQSALGAGAEYFVIRAMPNIACFVRDSATVIESPQPAFPDALLRVADTVFRCVGRVFYIKTPVFDVCTALCGSAPAFLTIVIEAMVDGAVSMGLGHMEALQMAAHTMRGTANTLLDGLEPRAMRHQIASPAGSTMQGLLALEQGNARSTISSALIVATNEARRLGTKEDE
jgi:pyrroline-5-carboxylate reductase